MLLSLASTHHVLGDFDLALDAYLKSEALEPDNETLRENLAKLLKLRTPEGGWREGSGLRRSEAAGKRETENSLSHRPHHPTKVHHN